MTKREVMGLTVFLLVLVLAAAPAYAQGRGGGAPPSRGSSGVGSSSGVGASSYGSGASSHGTTTDLAHSSPSDVLSHNTAIADKIGKLTNEDASTACKGFKNLGQCVAAAHVAKNLKIPGGFDALKTTMMGPPSESLGKAIQGLDLHADSKSEVKKANKQAADDLKEGKS